MHFFRPLLLLLLPLALLMQGCSLPHPMSLTSTERHQAVLRIGIAPDAPPYVYRKDGRITGLEIQFAADLARFTNSSPAFIELPRSDLFQALADGTIDIIMSGITTDEAQAKGGRATDPYLASGQVALVRVTDFTRLGLDSRHLGDRDVRLGAVTGTAGEHFVNTLDRKGRTFMFPSVPEGVQALLSYSIDAFIHEMSTNLYYASLHIDRGLTSGWTPMTSEKLAWVVHPDNEDLLQAARSYLLDLRQSGELGPLLERFIPLYQHAEDGSGS
ncbi:substrate-binding periplasmic protein [Desulfobulbus alkaliphilus]|uniref:substrate-binding periplasmic protein n=1 Tax=Desulfobulbus alkaliphilus TaxID=869814 RepID=UPI0019643151|nr:ABC transporter substrate-binding protein [Desulfobulbus alkaliphilus]MBM9536345.1 amino acid ABC transporter substrate-binding protein [Desulfobulbus alkaliphilus]